jgi:Ring finger domain
MSGQEEQQQQQPIGEHRHDDNVERFVDLMMLASVAPPPRGPSLLDYLYHHGVPISVSAFQRAGGVGGGDVNNWNNVEDVAAAILNRSLYDRHPVKKVITEEARLEIVDKKFTSAMVELEKINGICGIWQEQFEEGEGIKILPCNHAFKADAIMKWLEEEKAECPVCRFSLKSKEVNENQNFDDGHDDEYEEDEDEDEIPNNEPEPAAEPAQDNDAVRVNNIASRLVQSIAGRVSGRINHPSVSVPMNQFLQSVRMMSLSSRPREPIRAAVPSASGAAASPNSREAYANAGREVRAEALSNDNNNYNNNNYNNNNNNNNPVYNIHYNNYINNYNNNNYNNYNDDEDVVLNQEQADIEEAIRRSLEQI